MVHHCASPVWFKIGIKLKHNNLSIVLCIIDNKGMKGTNHVRWRWLCGWWFWSPRRAWRRTSAGRPAAPAARPPSRSSSSTGRSADLLATDPSAHSLNTESQNMEVGNDRFPGYKYVAYILNREFSFNNI